MNWKTILCLIFTAALIAGCASRPPVELPPVEPEPLEGEILEEEAIVPGEIEFGEESETELPPPPPEETDLSWEEIKALGTQYQVRPGDTLGEIAARFRVGTGLLARLNDIRNKDLIRVGQTLTVIEGPFRVEVDKSEKVLSLYLGDVFIRSYDATTGKNNSTPEGEFSVVRKLVEPPWTDPYHRTIISSDNPEYPLGTRWIEFVPPPGAYGIHGSREVDEIGREASFGCVRVLHPEEEEIYDFVTLGSPIVITP